MTNKLKIEYIDINQLKPNEYNLNRWEKFTGKTAKKL